VRRRLLLAAATLFMDFSNFMEESFLLGDGRRSKRPETKAVPQKIFANVR
jgi:hypothetical protein